MKRILALALTLSLLALPTAAPAAASGTEPTGELDAVVIVSEADLPALLASDLLGEYSLVSAADLGLDEAALAGVGLFTENSVLTPAQLGLDTPGMGFFGCCTPVFHGCCTPVVTPCCTPVFTFHACCVPVFSFRHFCCPLPFGGFPARVLIIRIGCC